MTSLPFFLLHTHTPVLLGQEGRQLRASQVLQSQGVLLQCSVLHRHSHPVHSVCHRWNHLLHCHSNTKGRPPPLMGEAPYITNRTGHTSLAVCSRHFIELQSHLTSFCIIINIAYFFMPIWNSKMAPTELVEPIKVPLWEGPYRKQLMEHRKRSHLTCIINSRNKQHHRKGLHVTNALLPAGSRGDILQCLCESTHCFVLLRSRRWLPSNRNEPITDLADGVRWYLSHLLHTLLLVSSCVVVCWDFPSSDVPQFKHFVI